MPDLSADELLNRALLEILHDGPGAYHIVTGRIYDIDIMSDLPWPAWRDASHHLEACPETTITAATGEDREVNTCNVAIISMTVQCPHVGSAPAQLDAYGHLSSLLDAMHRIADWVAPYEGDDTDA